TGTLTEGQFGVTDIVPMEGYEKEDVLSWGASVEQHSEHPIAKGMVEAAKESEPDLVDVKNFQSLTGEGIKGEVNGDKIHVVSPGDVNKAALTYNEVTLNKMSVVGETVVFVLKDEDVTGIIALAEIVRETAKEAISALKEAGVHCIMLTGDNKKVAHWVAEEIGVEEVYAEVLPDE